MLGMQQFCVHLRQWLDAPTASPRATRQLARTPSLANVAQAGLALWLAASMETLDESRGLQPYKAETPLGRWATVHMWWEPVIILDRPGHRRRPAPVCIHFSDVGRLRLLIRGRRVLRQSVSPIANQCNLPPTQTYLGTYNRRGLNATRRERQQGKTIIVQQEPTMAEPQKNVAEEFFPPRTQPTQEQIDAVRTTDLRPSPSA